jgi:ubiquinone/menaquinone biosynthesis C-methylase UbiE
MGNIMKNNNLNSKGRFSSRVDNYVKYRPHYPEEIIEFLRSELNMKVNDVIADIGSGTGFLSEIFLKNGNKVLGIEPNKDMRKAGEEYLKNYNDFMSIDGSAEETTLKEQSVDFVVVGQAFHWFDHEKCRTEFQRILKNEKFALLIWNERTIGSSIFMSDYENVMQKYSVGYDRSTNRNMDENKMKSFYGVENLNLKLFKNNQILDFEGLKGRTLSASYTPEENDPNHASFISELKEMFQKNQNNGTVEIIYSTRVYWGRL